MTARRTVLLNDLEQHLKDARRAARELRRLEAGTEAAMAERAVAMLTDLIAATRVSADARTDIRTDWCQSCRRQMTMRHDGRAWRCIYCGCDAQATVETVVDSLRRGTLSVLQGGERA